MRRSVSRDVDVLETQRLWVHAKMRKHIGSRHTKDEANPAACEWPRFLSPDRVIDYASLWSGVVTCPVALGSRIPFLIE